MQDAYSLRCAPQVHGAARDTARRTPPLVAGRELAAAVDNPVVTLDGRVESNGNFHGAPVGYVLDFLAIAVADVASMCERRTDRFLDVARSHGLPPFLADDPGVDSGHMIAQYTAAGIVCELKRLAVPASVDSIPSSAMQEDHVSMGWAAARKLRRAVDGLTRVLAIELLTAARALDLRAPLEPAAGHRRRAWRAARARRRRAPAPTATWPPRSRPPPTVVASGAVVAAAQSAGTARPEPRPRYDPPPRLPSSAARPEPLAPEETRDGRRTTGPRRARHHADRAELADRGAAADAA